MSEKEKVQVVALSFMIYSYHIMQSRERDYYHNSKEYRAGTTLLALFVLIQTKED
jgi:hypothetical protein